VASNLHHWRPLGAGGVGLPVDAGIGRTILITGASSGIGRACALELARLGYRVLAGVRRDEDGDALSAAAARRIEPIRLDVTNPGHIRDAAVRVEADGLHGLVNCAGCALCGPLELIPIQEFRQQLEVNVLGAAAVTQALLPAIRRSRGRIVNIGSVSGRVAAPFLGPYAASKFALRAISDSLRVELAPWGTSVSLVEAAAVATGIWTRASERAEELAGSCSVEARRLYEPALSSIPERARRLSRKALPVDRAVRAVVHALTAARPRARYYVGRYPGLLAIAELAPVWLRDRLIARMLPRYPQDEPQGKSAR